MKIYTVKPRGGWVADRDGMSGSTTGSEAMKAGFHARPSRSATQFVLVATSRQKGFRGILAKTYYSVWGK